MNPSHDVHYIYYKNRANFVFQRANFYNIFIKSLHFTINQQDKF